MFVVAAGGGFGANQPEDLLPTRDQSHSSGPARYDQGASR